MKALDVYAGVLLTEVLAMTVVKLFWLKFAIGRKFLSFVV